MIKPRFPETPVLSFEELPDDKAVEVVAVVGNHSGLTDSQRSTDTDLESTPEPEKEEDRT